MSDVDLHLSELELREICGYAHKAKQQMALAQMGIPFTVNPRGRILVQRETYTGKKRAKVVEPDFGAIRKRKAA